MGQRSPFWHVAGSPGRLRSLGKRLRKSLPTPPHHPPGLWDWENCFLHRQLLSPLPRDVLTLLVLESEKAESNTDVHTCSHGHGLNAGSHTGEAFCLVPCSTHSPWSPNPKATRLPEVARMLLVLFSQSTERGKWGAFLREGGHSICSFISVW